MLLVELEHRTRFGAEVVTIFDGVLSVDEHVHDTLRILERLGLSCLVFDRRCIKHSHVGLHPGAQ
jgi:hypothetical protein